MYAPFLCPPGNGVFTVKTAAEKKQALHQILFGTTDIQEVATCFYQQLDKIKDSIQDNVSILGVCSDTGGGILRGANWGPLFIREALYQSGMKLLDLGDVRVIPHLLHDKYLNSETIQKCQHALYNDNHSKKWPVSPLSIAEHVTQDLYAKYPNIRLLGLGGDHSVSYPLLKSYLLSKQQQGINVGLIHFDAHTDLLKERLGIDICFGSWLTHLLPLFKSPSQVIQLGIRSSGKPKSHWTSLYGIQQYWASEIRTQGIKNIVDAIRLSLEKDSVEELYITFDIDALDAEIAPATGTPEPNGMDLDEALFVIKALSVLFNVTGADLVEVAPMINTPSHINADSTLNAARSIGTVLIDSMK